MLGRSVFISMCVKITFSFTNIVFATAAYAFIDSTRKVFDLIFQREQRLDILSVPKYSKVVLATCENTELSIKRPNYFSDFGHYDKRKK